MANEPRNSDAILPIQPKLPNIRKAAGIRAIKTIAQKAVATIGSSVVISEVNWLVVLSASALAGILSLLTSVAGLPEVDNEKAGW